MSGCRTLFDETTGVAEEPTTHSLRVEGAVCWTWRYEEQVCERVVALGAGRRYLALKREVVNLYVEKGRPSFERKCGRGRKTYV